MKRTLIICLLLVAMGTLAAIGFTRFQAIDSCLDRGGAWNHETAACELEAR